MTLDHPKQNQACLKLATLPTSRLEDLSSDLYFELIRQYPVSRRRACLFSPQYSPSPHSLISLFLVIFIFIRLAIGGLDSVYGGSSSGGRKASEDTSDVPSVGGGGRTPRWRASEDKYAPR
jgi:hypothetical protein